MTKTTTTGTAPDAPLPWEDGGTPGEVPALPSGNVASSETALARREPGVPDLNAITLPATGSLADILDEQLALDETLLDDPSGEFAAGELGKTPAEGRYEVPSLAA